VKLETGYLLNFNEAGAGASGLAESTIQASRAAAVAVTMQQLIDDLPEQIALLDEQCNILAANRPWKRVVEQHGYPEAMPGCNYREFCARKAAEGYEPAIEALVGLRDICSGERSFWQLMYNGRERWSGRDYKICIHRISIDGEKLISVTRYDLTELLELRRAKADSTNYFVEGQTVERLRMARELHDSTSQLLTGAGLLLCRLKQEQAGERSVALVEELQELVMETQREIRLVSYLAHPPALDQMGLPQALKSVAEGFGRRTNLQTAFEIQGEPIPLTDAAESTLYRVAQEALSNVHRHAHAERVRVLLCFRRSATHLIVVDDGVGISNTALALPGSAGVGIASMHSRLGEIGGRLIVRRLARGTAVTASVLRRRNRAGIAVNR
jgi:two-component system NarL family sensor kinase